MAYVRIAESETDEPVELPLEDDGTLLFTTLCGQFPGVSSLNYRHPDTNSLRGVKLVDKKLHIPEAEIEDDTVFFCVYPKDSKRKSEDCSEAKAKLRKLEQKCTDLIVLGLPWETKDDSLKRYFEDYGEVVMAQVKINPHTERSKGFGFVRFSNYADQIRVLSQRHRIDGRWCDVKIPDSNFQGDGYSSNAQMVPSTKIFIGRLTEDITVEDLKIYFSEFGDVNDVFIPKPFRGFAFVTFVDAAVAQSLVGEDHIINGHSVVATTATPKGSRSRNQNMMGNQNMGGGNRGPPMNMQRNPGSMDFNEPPNMGGGDGNFNNNMNFPNLDSAAIVSALTQTSWGRNVLSSIPGNFGGGGGGGNYGGGSNQNNYSNGNYSGGQPGSYGNQGYGGGNPPGNWGNQNPNRNAGNRSTSFYRR